MTKEIQQSFDEYLKTKDSEYSRMYGHHLTTFIAGYTAAQKEKGFDINSVSLQNEVEKLIEDAIQDFNQIRDSHEAKINGVHDYMMKILLAVDTHNASDNQPQKVEDGKEGMICDYCGNDIGGTFANKYGFNYHLHCLVSVDKLTK